MTSSNTFPHGHGIFTLTLFLTFDFKVNPDSYCSVWVVPNHVIVCVSFHYNCYWEAAPLSGVCAEIHAFLGEV